MVLIRYKGTCDNVWRHAGGGGGVGEASGSGPGHATGILASGEWGPRALLNLLQDIGQPLPQRIILSKRPECQD